MKHFTPNTCCHIEQLYLNIFSHKHPPTWAPTDTFAVCVFMCWLRAWLAFPPVTTPLSLSAKGGEGSSPMPKGRVPPTVCRGRGGWAGLVTRASHLWGHVFVSPSPVSLAVVGVTVELCSTMSLTLNWNPVGLRHGPWFLKEMCLIFVKMLIHLQYPPLVDSRVARVTIY